MLFKNLKAIMEAAAPPADAAAEAPAEDGTITTPEQTELKRKPKAVTQASKEASDGVGNESYTVSNSIVETINTALSSMAYDLVKIYANKNSIFLEFRVAKDGTVLLKTSKDKSTGIPSETLYDVIQQLITAALQKDIDKFSLNGPIRTSGNGDSKLMITVVPTPEETVTKG